MGFLGDEPTLVIMGIIISILWYAWICKLYIKSKRRKKIKRKPSIEEVFGKSEPDVTTNFELD